MFIIYKKINDFKNFHNFQEYSEIQRVICEQTLMQKKVYEDKTWKFTVTFLHMLFCFSSWCSKRSGVEKYFKRGWMHNHRFRQGVCYSFFFWKAICYLLWVEKRHTLKVLPHSIKLTANKPWTGLSNEILCILVAQGASKLY